MPPSSLLLVAPMHRAPSHCRDTLLFPPGSFFLAGSQRFGSALLQTLLNKTKSGRYLCAVRDSCEGCHELEVDVRGVRSER
ncbi:hypothetical protein FKM82_028334 [Ascaphus truei]